MSDNQSFLKLIGVEEAQVAAVPLSESESESESDPEALTEEPFQPELAEPYELTEREMTSGDGTQVYTAEDLESLAKTLPEKTLTHFSRRTKTKTKTRATQTLRDVAELTGGTMLLNEPQVDVGESRTAHFDYDQDQSGARLVVLDGRTNAKAFHLHELPLRIGRDPENEVVLDDHNSSRFHAEIQDEAGSFKVVDLGSTNGLKVNGQMVTEHVLESHDVIQIGDCLLEFLPTGEISRGLPQSQAMADTASLLPRQTSTRKRMLVFAIVLGLAAAAFIYSQKAKEVISKKAVEMVGQEATQELAQLNEELVAKYQKPIDAIPAADLKKALIDRIQSSSIGKLIPESLKQKVDTFSPDILKVLMSDPAMIPKIIESGGSEEAIGIVLREKLNDLIAQKKFVVSLDLAKSLQQMNPESEAIKNIVNELEEMVPKDDGSISQPIAPENDDQKKFYDYLDKFDSNFQELILAKKYQEALDFARLVREKMDDLVRMDSSFQKITEPMIKKWNARIESLGPQVEDQKGTEQKKDTQDRKMESRFMEIKFLWDSGEFGRVIEEIEKFEKDYPDSDRIVELDGIRKEIEDNVSKSFEKTKSEVELHIQTETYEMAWKTLYLFIDNMPRYAGAVQLHTRLDGLTRARAVQYYNQARVYEYEADDLISAEQHYKKAVEFVDPRSDLYAKAQRRFDDVRRKNMK